MNATPWNPPIEGRLPKKPSNRAKKSESTHDFPLSISGASRACGEVCPKHQNIRHENLRVRPRTGGNGFDLSAMRDSQAPAGMSIAPNIPQACPATPFPYFHE